MHCFKADYLFGGKGKKISHSDILPPKYLLTCYLHAYVLLKTTCFRKALNRIVFFYIALQAGIEFKKNLRVRFGKYGGLKLEYF